VKSGWRIWDWRQKQGPSWSSLAMIPIHRVRLERRLGRPPDDVMKGIKRALIFALDLNMALG
jgi:hypothetical protein